MAQSEPIRRRLVDHKSVGRTSALEAQGGLQLLVVISGLDDGPESDLQVWTEERRLPGLQCPRFKHIRGLAWVYAFEKKLAVSAVPRHGQDTDAQGSIHGGLKNGDYTCHRATRYRVEQRANVVAIGRELLVVTQFFPLRRVFNIGARHHHGHPVVLAHIANIPEHPEACDSQA